MSNPAKTEVRLSRDAKVPRGAKVTLDVTLTYEVPWDDLLDSYNEKEMTIAEAVDALRVTYGRHTPMAAIASKDGWDVLSDQGDEFSVSLPDEAGEYHEEGIVVEQEWENESRKKVGGYVPARREYREVLS